MLSTDAAPAVAPREAPLDTLPSATKDARAATATDIPRLTGAYPAPVLGMGTANFGDRKLLVDAVCSAVKQGIRLFDTAQSYGSEQGLGDALQVAGVAREELFLSCKIDLAASEDPAARVSRQVKSSLANLHTTYLDSVIFHWPIALDRHDADNAAIRKAAWLALEEFVAAGVVRHIGVSNWTAELLRETLSYATVRPAVNQIEFSPVVYQRELLQFCKDEGITVVGYSSYGTCWMAMFEPDHVPWGVTNLNKDPAVAALAKEVGRTPAQVCLRWCMHKGVVVIPKTSKASRIREALGVFDFSLTPDQIAVLDAMRDERRGAAASIEHHSRIIAVGYKGDQKNEY